MNRRYFTKVAGVSMIGAFAGCTSLDPGSDDDGEGTDDPAESDDEQGDNEQADEEEDGNEEEQDSDNSDDDDEIEEEQDEQETDNGEEQDDEQEADDEEEQTDDEGDEQETDDEQPQEDDSPETDEMEAEISMGSELDGLLEVVHHEFSWESGEGSHLCNINLEVRNTSTDHQLHFEAVGEIVDENGIALAGDINQFGLDPEETGSFTFSVDQCGEATGYQLTFNAHDVVEVSD